MHTLLDLRGNIPTFIGITDGKVHDVNMLDEILPEAGAFYVMDRGYVDFERLFVFTLSAAFFVIRTKYNVLLQRRYSHPVDKSTGVRSDHTVILTTINQSRPTPTTLRRDQLISTRRNQQAVQFLTNNFDASGTDHRPDLQVALAGGTVLQMDQAASADQGILRHQRERGEDPDLDRGLGLRAGGHHPQETDLEASLYQILQILSVTLFEKTPIYRHFKRLTPTMICPKTATN